jgi:hypothetical protein
MYCMQINFADFYLIIMFGFRLKQQLQHPGEYVLQSSDILYIVCVPALCVDLII